MLVYLYGKVPAWVAGLATFLWLIVLIGILFWEADWQEASERDAENLFKAEEQSRNAVIAAEKAKSEAEAAERRTALEARDNSINLTYTSLNISTRCLRVVTEELRKFTAENKKDDQAFQYLKNSVLHEVTQNIRFLFEGDSRGVERTSYPHNYFKVAIYEASPSPSSPVKLCRSFYDYPEGMQPSSLTTEYDLETDGRAAVVRAFKVQGTIVIEDIKREVTKGNEAEMRWINKRPDQAREYNSMVNTAIVSGRKGGPDRKCLGVLVIDTNREKYFKEDRAYEGFLGGILNPFRTILTLALELPYYLGGEMEASGSSMESKATQG